MEVVEACPENSLADSPTAAFWRLGDLPAVLSPPPGGESPLELQQYWTSVCLCDRNPAGTFPRSRMHTSFEKALGSGPAPAPPPPAGTSTHLSLATPSINRQLGKIPDLGMPLLLLLGLGGGQVVAVEQGRAAHYGQKPGMRHVGRPTGLTELLPSKRQGLAAAVY